MALQVTRCEFYLLARVAIFFVSARAMSFHFLAFFLADLIENQNEVDKVNKVS